MTVDLSRVLICATDFASIVQPNECATGPGRPRRASRDARREPPPACVDWPYDSLYDPMTLFGALTGLDK